MSSPASKQGYAIRMYAASTSMTDCSFCNADGDFLIVPQLGLTQHTHLRTACLCLPHACAAPCLCVPNYLNAVSDANCSPVKYSLALTLCCDKHPSETDGLVTTLSVQVH